MKKYEKIIEAFLLICATVATLSVFLITFFIFKEGLPILKEYGIIHFVFGKTWSPTNGSYGAFPMIMGSISVTLGALIIGVPMGISCAVFLAEIAPKSIVKIFKPAIELLAGIPSVVYGFFGLAILVPLIRMHILPIIQKFNGEAYTSGYSILAGAMILAVMILPTIVNISENAIRSVPIEYKQGSLALGATQFETIIKVILPAAKSGIITSVVLGMGRAVGETMAVILVTGNMPKVPGSVLDSVSTLTGTIAMEMGYATPTHQKALFATGVILFVFIMLLNVSATWTMKRLGGE
ncbi:phosphate ABC transporter permease subunit PstC [Marinisporobacter balticus]|uniref:Phosphate transport system permease protein n=1 Tax=Marinisporobacter balticus TaxID=2018667 RepID=A0A4R2L5T1_9FIRM|nr:phosphate ABC transporter permease subunit PstC [Marinisporobacter balticus]TCO79286.1 phosphate ABC transporter membrane protein 1 (PhoT family) [Marinisporobacter balticus]